MPDIKTDYCQQCACLEGGTGMTYGTGSTLPPGTDGTTSLCHNDRFVNDGYCDDSTNTELCNFDGGDCCYKKSNYQYCNDCICYPGAPEIIGIAKRINMLLHDFWAGCNGFATSRGSHFIPRGDEMIPKGCYKTNASQPKVVQ